MTYIKDFALIAYPLTELTKQHQPYMVVWQEMYEQAFTALKSCLVDAVKLHTVEHTVKQAFWSTCRCM